MLTTYKTDISLTIDNDNFEADKDKAVTSLTEAWNILPMYSDSEQDYCWSS